MNALLLFGIIILFGLLAFGLEELARVLVVGGHGEDGD